MKWAFSDESRRRGAMFVGVAVVATHDVAAARARMRGLLLPGQRRLHLTDERSSPRSTILGAVLELPAAGFVARASTSGRRIVDVRRELLTHVLDALLADGVDRWTLDGVERIQRDRDRAVIGDRLRALGGERLLYDHQPSSAEPLLWLADAITWPPAPEATQPDGAPTGRSSRAAPERATPGRSGGQRGRLDSRRPSRSSSRSRSTLPQRARSGASRHRCAAPGGSLRPEPSTRSSPPRRSPTSFRCTRATGATTPASTTFSWRS